jgi:hypothetical protein
VTGRRLVFLAVLLWLAMAPTARCSPPVIEIASPLPAPTWALLERELLRAVLVQRILHAHLYRRIVGAEISAPLEWLYKRAYKKGWTTIPVMAEINLA